MRHSGGKRAETGEPVAPANLELETFQRRDIGENHEDAQHLALLPMKDRAARAHHHAALGRVQNELAIFRSFLRLERLLHQLADRGGQVLYRVIEQVLGFRTGDLFRFVIEDGDTAIRARGNHTGREVLEKNLVINLRVLDFGKQLRIVDRDGQLPAEDLERILFDAAINPP